MSMGEMSGVLNSLIGRNIVSQVSSLSILPKAAYAGFDPTADSLHLGHLSVLATLLRFNLFGHKVVALVYLTSIYNNQVGDVTAAMGDPMFRANVRPDVENWDIHDNTQKIQNQIRQLLDLLGISAEKHGAGRYSPENTNIRLNSSWFSKMPAIEFISKYGKLFQAKSMMAHEGYWVFSYI